jgi:hypothetical protein
MFRSRVARLVATFAAGLLCAGSAAVVTAPSAAAACSAPGTIQALDGSCYYTPQGTYMPYSGYDFGFKCPLPYTTPSHGATSQSQCYVGAPAGSYATDELYDGGGVFTPFWRVAIKLCEPGSYQPYTSSSSCYPAPPGRYIPYSGATNSSSGYYCPPGTFSTGGAAAACTSAPPGTRPNLNPGGTAVVYCEAGTSSPGGLASCNWAPPGSYAPWTGMFSPYPCAAGTYSSSYGATACTPASVDHYVPTEGATSQTACAAGTHQPTPGSTSCIPIPTAPDAPTVTDSAPSASSVSVAFTPGGDGGSPITGYTAECVSSDGGVTGTASGPGSPISVTGLTTGKHYQCRVKATNDVGDSAYGELGSAVLAASEPDPPTVTDSTPDLTSVSVGFSPGAANGSALTGFSAECVSTDGGAAGTASGAGSPISVAGLTTGKLYHCRVKATNGVGDSAYGEFGPTVLTATEPEPPAVTGSTAGLTSVSVTFSSGAANGSPITGYTAECVSSDGGVTGTATGPESPISVTGLTTGKHYQCRVKATNDVGDSAYGELGPTLLTATEPGAPTVTGSAAGPGAVSVTFSPAAANGSPVTDHTVECASSDGGITNTATGVAGPLTVTGLSPGKRYRCRAKATNGVGEGPYGALGPEVLVPTLPGKPVVAKSQSKSPTKLTVKLSLGDDGGSPVTQFEVACKSSNGGKAKTVTSTRSTVAVTKLTPGKTYRCKARAGTAVGWGAWSGKGPKTVLPPAARVSAAWGGSGRLVTAPIF